MSEEKKDDTRLTASNVKTEDSEDLDSLLDSALDDFNKVSETKPSASVENSSNNEEETSEEDKVWAEMLKKALDVDPNMKGLFGQGSADQDKFVSEFSKIAEAAAKVFDGENPTDFTNIMSETLQNLNQSSEAIQNQFGNPEELANLFQELGLGSAAAGVDGSIDNMPPFMQTLMQSFLSKDILYPSMKEFVGRYPAWLEENKPKLPADQFDNYSKQLELMKSVVTEYEAESESDSEDVKNQRFQRIMSHIQEMQALGQPPIELISDVPLDEASMPNLPPNMDPSQCSLM